MRPAGRWEVGGDFDERDDPTGSRLPWPTPHRLYGLATHAMTALWDSLPSSGQRVLHVPDYFCPEVVTAWKRHGIPLRTFLDDPQRHEPDWSSLSCAAGDVVLAVNLFGVRGGVGWSRWRHRYPDLLMVEDHSHDPGSGWARRSVADYAFASLRKTVAISDGAILWSPRGAQLPGPPRANPTNGADVKRAAMGLKREYLAGAAVDKKAFRTLQIRGEQQLLASSPGLISPASKRTLSYGLPVAWRDRRRRNVRLLMDEVAEAVTMRPLFATWPRDHCPFNLVLVFPDEPARDACRAFLIERLIYPPVHWAQPPDASQRTRDLASTILTVPADQRYDLTDMRRVASALLAFDDAWQGGRIAAPIDHSRSRGAR